jgi:restriction system protein
MIPGAKGKHEKAIQEAEARYQAAQNEYNNAAAQRTTRLDRLRADYERDREAFLLKLQQRNGEVDELESAYQAGDGEAIIAYNNMVLERSEYPDDFPQEFRLAYSPESRELVSEYELPGVDVIPAASEYKYVKARNAKTRILKK